MLKCNKKLKRKEKRQLSKSDAEMDIKPLEDMPEPFESIFEEEMKRQSEDDIVSQP